MPTTYGDFISQIEIEAERTGVEVLTILMEWIAKINEREWQALNQLELNNGLVHALAVEMTRGFAERLRGISSTELYRDVLQEGHRFLRAIHRAATEMGCAIDISEVDLPICPSEIVHQVP